MRNYLLLTTSLLAFTALPAAAQTKLTMNISSPPLSAITKAHFKPWKADVERVTEGRISIFVPAASLAPPTRQWSLVASQGADMAMTPNSVQRGRLKLPLLAELPFTTPTAQSASVALWRTQNKFFNGADEYKGMKLLTQWVTAGYSLQSRNRAITKMEDFKGLKIRTQPGLSKVAIRTLGSAVVTAPIPKSFELISKGTVDAMLNGHSVALAFKYSRYLKHVTDFPGMLGSNSFSFFMNRKTWDGLSKKDQEAILSVSGEKAAIRVGGALDRQNNAGLRVIKKTGAQAHMASPELVKTVRGKLAFIEQNWLKSAASRNIDGAEALAYFKKTATELAAAGKKKMMKK